MKNCKFIVFSGGCYSGKTTTMKLAKEIFEKQGIKVVMLDEIVRKFKIESIDDLRKDAVRYLRFQNTVIRAKIGAETGEYYKNDKCIVLVDRAITDSMFYLLFYTDKHTLSSIDMIKLNKLYRVANKHAIKAFSEIYDVLIEFKPLAFNGEKQEKDKYRPEKLGFVKSIEYRMINTLNEAHFAIDGYRNCSYMQIDLNTSKDTSEIFETIGINTLEQWKQLSI